MAAARLRGRRAPGRDRPRGGGTRCAWAPAGQIAPHTTARFRGIGSSRRADRRLPAGPPHARRRAGAPTARHPPDTRRGPAVHDRPRRRCCRGRQAAAATSCGLGAPAPCRARSLCPAGADELACTPGSVPARGHPRAGGDHPSTTYVAARLQRSTRELGRAALERSLSDLAPGGVCLAAPVTRCAGGLLHHRFTLTPSVPKVDRGGLFSVALSRGSPRVGVTHHLALRSPDVPR